MPLGRWWRFRTCLAALLALAGAAGTLVAQMRPADRPAPLGVARVWHGRTPAAKADEYAKLILDGDIRQIRSLPGNLGVQVLRRTDGGFTDFTVISYWPSRDAIRQWAGDNLEQAKYSDKEREYLINPEPTVTHYDIVFNEGRATR
jgi:heme-degrading monooxygenase HmoA